MDLSAFQSDDLNAKLETTSLLFLEAHHSPALRVLAERIWDGAIRPGCIVSLPPGQSFTPGNLEVLPDTVLVVVSSDLTLANTTRTVVLPPGYPLINPAALNGGSKLETGTHKALLLEIPRSEFMRLYQTDREFRLAFEKTLAAVHPRRPMPNQALEQLRRGRDENIRALVTRAGIKLLNRRQDILQILNPEGHDVLSPYEMRDQVKRITNVQQTWAIIRSISGLTSYFSENELRNLAREARGAFDGMDIPEADRAGLAIHMFRVLVAKKERDVLSRHLPRTLEVIDRLDLKDDERKTLLSRIVEVAWLAGSMDRPKDSGVSQKIDIRLASLASISFENTDGSLSAMLVKVDRWIEKSFDSLRNRGASGIIPISIERRDAALALDAEAGKELASDHPSCLALKDLRERLLRGEVSAVGGSEYTEMRFPEEMLENLCKGDIDAVLFNGNHQDGINYVRHKYGLDKTNPGILEPCIVMNLVGAYGSFARSWIFFRDGRPGTVLVSHHGGSRQLSNAGALLLFRNADNQRVPLDRLHLVDSGPDLREMSKQALRNVLAQAKEHTKSKIIGGTVISDPDALPTQVAILMNPEQLKEAFGDRIVLERFDGGCLGPITIGYLKLADGKIIRLIVPTVGGAGLYGDSAGAFVEAAFDTSIIPKLIPNILFSATGGGLAGTDNLSSFKAKGVRGLPMVAPNGFLMPVEEVHDDLGVVKLHTLLAKCRKMGGEFLPLVERLEELLEQSKVYRYSRHYCVLHPADETFQKIEHLVSELLIASVDVEAGPIARALEKIRAVCPGATFTPIYNFSDDPRSGKMDHSLTLAYGGPLHDNGGFDRRLSPILAQLIELSATSYFKEKEAA